MSAISIKVNPSTFKDINRLDHILTEWLRRLSDYTPLNQRLAKYMKADTRSRISRYKVSPDGTGWEELSPATLELRARIGRLSPKHVGVMAAKGNILLEHGDLLEGIQISEVGPKGFVVKSTSAHSAFMQYGVASTSGFIKGATVPARPFMGFSAANKRFIRKATAEYLLKEHE